jgi:hypothetical protein
MFFFCYILDDYGYIIINSCQVAFLGQSIEKSQSLYRLAHGARPGNFFQTKSNRNAGE